MTSALCYLAVIAAIGVFFVGPSWFTFRREEEHARKLLAEARLTGRDQPASIRPWVNLERCMGSGACVAACPEGDVLQVIDGHAQLVNAAACVGHGACELACPMGAVELRFGSEKRGVDIPAVGPDFRSNVDGLYIAGELGGMGLIANAMRQGGQAVTNLQRELRPRRDGGLDLLIVGAGPAGIAASLAAKKADLKHVVLEQDSVGGSILHYPRKKVVMAHGLQLPGRPKVRAGTITKAELVDMLTAVVSEESLPVAEGERVGPDATRETLARIERSASGFAVTTGTGTYDASRVLLAVGRRGTPRKLGVPGEDHEKVAYRLVDAQLVHHEHVLVVGGGDSALEAACALAESPGNRVTLSYRRDHLTRPKTANRERLEAAVEAGQVELALGTVVTAIAPDRVTLGRGEEELVRPNDRVFVFAGGILPTKLLMQAGIRVERHFGDRIQTLA